MVITVRGLQAPHRDNNEYHMAKTSLIEGDVQVDAPLSQSGRIRLRHWRRPTGHDLSALRVPSGLPWILPALVLCVGLIYYCVGYTGYISTLSWDGVSPNPPSVGIHNYTGVFHDPVFWVPSSTPQSSSASRS